MELLESIFESEQNFCRPSFSQQLEKEFSRRGRWRRAKTGDASREETDGQVEKLPVRQVPVCKGRVLLSFGVAFEVVTRQKKKEETESRSLCDFFAVCKVTFIGLLNFKFYYKLHTYSI